MGVANRQREAGTYWCAPQMPVTSGAVLQLNLGPRNSIRVPHLGHQDSQLFEPAPAVCQHVLLAGNWCQDFLFLFLFS